MTLHFAHAHANCTRLLDRRVEPGDEANQNYAIINPQEIAIASSLHLDVMSQRPSGLYIVNGIDPQTHSLTIIQTH